jgi:hypothetical protein
MLAAGGVYFLYFDAAAQKKDPIVILLDLPAPPPPNPLVKGMRWEREEKFYNKNNPPGDNAPIDELLDYWERQSTTYQAMRYAPEPSERTLDRLMKEIGKNHKLLPAYLNLLKREPEFVKGLYDQEGAGGIFDRETRRTLKRWLTYNSSYFSSDLARLASGVSDTGEYVSNQEELLALTHVDFEKAKPLVDRLYNDSSLKTSRVLARWALYKHALKTGSPGDVERYRDELKEVVEDKNALAGMRDLALDALSSEKEWSGRDEWYYSLMEDETLGELNVNGSTYTGLTTLILASPEEKYIAKMIELAGSSNKAVRSAAVRNLITRLETGGPEVVKALLPWLEDPKWATDSGDTRGALIRRLGEYEMPESVPGLIKVLDEKGKVPNYNAMANVANSVANSADALTRAANAIQTAANAMATAANSAANATKPASNGVAWANTLPYQEGYPYRSSAVTALAKQKDMRAVPPLRRVLPEVNIYERGGVVKAILVSGGFTVGEQMNALERIAKDATDAISRAAEAYANSPNANYPPAYDSSYIARYANEAAYAYNGKKMPLSNADIQLLLGEQLTQSEEISDPLARALVDRIEVLDKRDTKVAAVFRQMILKWQNAAINMLLLRDVKRGVADADTIIRLLSQRKQLREQQSIDVFDLRTGKPSAIGIAACLLDDAADYVGILETGNEETRAAMLACARLMRAPLPVPKVAESLKSANETLQLAAERYLESEDSLEARALVLARHPGEAKILGATTAFFTGTAGEFEHSEYLWELFRSLGDNSLYYGWGGTDNDDDLRAIEKDLREEVKKDTDLLGVYAYSDNYVRIYKDRVIYSWDEDESRYRERLLKKEEFDELKDYLTGNNADAQPPFLACGGPYCSAKELVMVGRNGGRRVYLAGEAEMFAGSGTVDFFIGLDKYFERLKGSPAKLKYALSREIPGLEIVVAQEDLSAATVWKERDDLRIAASQTAVREKVKTETENLEDDDVPVGEEVEPGEHYAEQLAAKAKRRYEGYAWYRILNGEIEEAVAQPAGVEFIPLRDALTVQPGEGQWKARTGMVEIRASDEGLFRIQSGKLVKLKDGAYRKPIVTPDGRWAVVQKAGEEYGERIVRVDLLTKREYPVELERYGSHLPVAFVPSVNKVLVLRNYYSYAHSDEDEEPTPDDPEPDGMILVDAATGKIQPVAGEFRPLAQQTFRPLQNTSRPNEFWAAIHDAQKGGTEVGILETRFFGFRSVLRVPKIKFNSMSMWVDEAGGKVYFVYRGHLLSLPLPPTK